MRRRPFPWLSWWVGPLAGNRGLAIGVIDDGQRFRVRVAVGQRREPGMLAHGQSPVAQTQRYEINAGRWSEQVRHLADRLGLPPGRMTAIGKDVSRAFQMIRAMEMSGWPHQQTAGGER